MSVRRAVPADAEAMAALQVGAFGRPWSARDIAAVLGDPLGLGVLALDRDGAAVGFALAFGREDVDVMVVVTRWDLRRRGHARAAMASLIALAREKGAAALTLEVAVENEAARTLYENLGFLPVALRRGYYAHADGTTSDAVLMRLDLAGSGRQDP